MKHTIMTHPMYAPEGTGIVRVFQNSPIGRRLVGEAPYQNGDLDTPVDIELVSATGDLEIEVNGRVEREHMPNPLSYLGSV